MAAGPDGVMYPDHVYDVPRKFAQELIRQGYAEPVKQKPETATMKPAEQAVKPAPEKRGK